MDIVVGNVQQRQNVASTLMCYCCQADAHGDHKMIRCFSLRQEFLTGLDVT